MLRPTKTHALAALVTLSMLAGCASSDTLAPTEPEEDGVAAALSSCDDDALCEWAAVPVTIKHGAYEASAFADQGPLENCAGRPETLGIMYLGGTGMWPASADELRGLAQGVHVLRSHLRGVCTRMVVVGGHSSYVANVHFDASIGAGAQARASLSASAQEVGLGINQLLARGFPGVDSYIYFGGSMSAMVGARLFDEDRSFDDPTPNDASGRPWQPHAYRDRLVRTFLVGPPAGNIVNVCNHSKPGTDLQPNGVSRLAVRVLSGRSCDEVAGLPIASGDLFEGLAGFSRLPHVNAYIGSHDEIFGFSEAEPGYWRGVDGVLDFAATQPELGCPHEGCAEGAEQGESALTFREVQGATHTNVWTFVDGGGDVALDICEKAAFDRGRDPAERALLREACR